MGFQEGKAAMSEETIKVYRVMRPDCGRTYCIYRTWGEVESEFDGADDEDVIHVQLLRMTEAEFDALPDFQGW